MACTSSSLGSCLAAAGHVSSLPRPAGGRQGGLFGGAASGGATRPPSAGAQMPQPGHTGGMAPVQQHDSGGTELGRFLRARRSQVAPADVGFTPGAGVRRTLAR